MPSLEQILAHVEETDKAIIDNIWNGYQKMLVRILAEQLSIPTQDIENALDVFAREMCISEMRKNSQEAFEKEFYQPLDETKITCSPEEESIYYGLSGSATEDKSKSKYYIGTTPIYVGRITGKELAMKETLGITRYETPTRYDSLDDALNRLQSTVSSYDDMYYKIKALPRLPDYVDERIYDRHSPYYIPPYHAIQKHEFKHNSMQPQLPPQRVQRNVRPKGTHTHRRFYR